jgi:hypothetical protein
MIAPFTHYSERIGGPPDSAKPLWQAAQTQAIALAAR